MGSDVFRRFEQRHERTLGRAPGGGPPWEDGSDAAALLAIAWHLEPMIGNGGWPAVFYNRTAWAVPLAARGYRLLGMAECAERCESALRMVRAAEDRFPDHDHAGFEWLSVDLMDAVGDSEWDRLDQGWSELTAGTRAAIERYLRASEPPSD